MATVMTTITTLAVVGMVVIAADPKIMITAKHVNAWTVHMSSRATHASKTSRKAVAPQNSRATASVTTRIMLVDVLGTAVTAVESKPSKHIANCANAWIAPRRSPKIAKGRQRVAGFPNSSKTRIVTTKTIIVDVTGTGVTVARRPTMALSSQNIASNVNVWTPITKATVAVKEAVNFPSTKAMATVTTRTTTVVASTTAVIAVPKPSRGGLSKRLIASNASVWIPRAAAEPLLAPQNAELPRTKGMVSATTTTTTAVARTMVVIVVSKPTRASLSKRPTAKYVRASILKESEAPIID